MPSTSWPSSRHTRNHSYESNSYVEYELLSTAAIRGIMGPRASARQLACGRLGMGF